MNTVASCRNLRPNGLKTDRILQFLVGLVVCVWLVYQITHLQLGSVRIKIRENVVNSLGRKERSGQLNASKNDEESSSNQVDLQGGKRGEIAYLDETNKNDEGSSSNQVDLQGGKRGEIAYSDETNKNDKGSSSNQVDLQEKDELGIDQEEEENSFHDENGIPKEMRDGKSAGSSSLNDQSESS